MHPLFDSFLVNDAFGDPGLYVDFRDRRRALLFDLGDLGRLKHALLTGAPEDTPIDVKWHDGDGGHASTRTVRELRSPVVAIAPGRRVGYVTELRHTAATVDVLVRLLGGVDHLYIERVFLDADRDHGERKHHLTARQAGEIARRVGAGMVTPFHLSPRYQGRAQALCDEVLAAWTGDAAPPSAPASLAASSPGC